MSAKRIELLTNGLKGHCSTIELRAHTDTYFNMPLYSRQSEILKTLFNLRGLVCGWGLVLLGGGLGGFYAGWFWVGRTEKDSQVIEGFKVIFQPSANIAYPGREIGNCHQVLIKPGEISDHSLVHLADVALAAWDHAGWVVKTPQLVRQFSGGMLHLILKPLYHWWNRD